jgi:hypothetical protein
VQDFTSELLDDEQPPPPPPPLTEVAPHRFESNLCFAQRNLSRPPRQEDELDLDSLPPDVKRVREMFPDLPVPAIQAALQKVVIAVDGVRCASE